MRMVEALAFVLAFDWFGSLSPGSASSRFLGPTTDEMQKLTPASVSQWNGDNRLTTSTAQVPANLRFFGSCSGFKRHHQCSSLLVMSFMTSMSRQPRSPCTDSSSTCLPQHFYSKFFCTPVAAIVLVLVIQYSEYSVFYYNYNTAMQTKYVLVQWIWIPGTVQLYQSTSRRKSTMHFLLPVDKVLYNCPRTKNSALGMLLHLYVPVQVLVLDETVKYILLWFEKSKPGRDDGEGGELYIKHWLTNCQQWRRRKAKRSNKMLEGTAPLHWPARST